MSSTTLQILIAGILFVNGIGHALGIIAALKLANVNGWSSNSWLLTSIIGETASRVICFLLFLVVLIGIVGAADHLEKAYRYRFGLITARRSSTPDSVWR